jgi:hypothetical protein
VIVALDRLALAYSCSLGPVTCLSSRIFGRFHFPPPWSRAAPIQPATFTIPSYSQSNRRPANIPLHTLSSSARPRDHDSAYLLDGHDKDSPRSSFDTPSDDSDLSLWSDTGDLVDQLAEREDPLRIRLDPSLEGSHQPKHRGHQKRAHFETPEGFHEKTSTGIRKEDIDIPDPGPRTISKAERIIATIMAPNDGPSRIHGLHGKKLMYVHSTQF